MSRFACHLLVVCALSSIAPLSAFAQGAGDDEARALFREGVTASQAGEWGDAADAFGRSLELRRSPVVVFNLASALVRLDRLSEAAELFEEVIAWEGARTAVRDAAQERLAEVEPRLSHLGVTLDGAEPDDELRLDDRAFAPDEVVAVDPGAHNLEVLRDGDAVLSSDLALAEGETRNVRLDVPPVVPDAATTAAIAVGQTGQDETILVDDGGGSVFETWWFWTAIGVVAATAITVVLVAILDTTPDPIVGNTEPGVLRGMVEP